VAILASVEKRKEDWPKAAYLAVLERFARMPRSGWSRAKEYFCEKFTANISMTEFKAQAQKAVVTATGRPCTLKDFSPQEAKRRKTVESMFEENTLYEAKLYNHVKDMFLAAVKERSKTPVDEPMRTRKVPGDRLDRALLGILNRLAGEYAAVNNPQSMADLARIIQAVQMTYEAGTTRMRKQSEWRPNIERKIAALKATKTLLEQVKDGVVLSTAQQTQARKAMREHKLTLSKPHDVTEAVTLIGHDIQVYEKKLVVSDHRKEFRRANHQFELYRGRFYRELAGENTREKHNVPNEAVKDFWTTMWNKDEAAEDMFDEYLVGFEAGEDPAIAFPTHAEFLELVKYLPNWKAAGVDGIYNFFIKHIDTLH